MKMGTRSLLFGVHQFAMHPVLVAIAWRRLHGCWPCWWEAICILVHDWGYWGCAEMDGPEGVMHPLGGAVTASRVVRFLSGDEARATQALFLCMGHSRSYAKLAPCPTSRLMRPDKLSNALVPERLYLALARATGELAEFRANADEYQQRTGLGCPLTATDSEWFRWMTDYMRRAAEVTT